MFKDLEDFGAVRTWKQAVGFYLAFLGMYLLVGATTGVVVALSTGSAESDLIYRVAGPLVVLMTAAICILMITKKKLGFMFWILGVLACGLSVIGGGILGLLIPAYISTVAHAMHPTSDTPTA
ncbi:MAG: hypothetical protein KBD06_05115 [Candidatus Pacebacteria bacterium]|nr:hypothetical protein [Candidatus Paceibacterota bacterium]